MSIEIKKLFDRCHECSYKDARDFSRKIRQASKVDDETTRQERLSAIQDKLDTAWLAQQQRQERVLDIQYPPQLPVSQHVEKIVEALQQNQVIIVAGETGSGKTTQLPKACLQAGLGRKGLIGHTQPRRLAARTVSNRIAEELNSHVGDLVGYQVRFTDRVSDQTFIKVMTDGILLNEIKFDRYLNQYEVIIIDEAHERSLNIDFLLGYLKKILAKRPELKLVITSATIDVDRFSEFFSGAPVFSVSGRSYPVDIEYRPPQSASEYEQSLSEQIASIVEDIKLEEKQRSWPIGDILLFLPGEREIRELSKALRDYDWRDTEVVPLYARLNERDQNKIFQKHSGRRIVLSTNVAETSITVPGIRYVIDPGTVRMSRYSYRSKLQRLPIEPVSQASANQRMGRCGRVAEGICYRLYDENDFLSRPEFTDPEILRTNLAAVILKMLDSGIGDVYSFEFINAPEKKLWNDGFKLLHELEAIDESRKLSKTGKQLAAIPADPRLAKMLIKAAELGSLKEVLIIVSGLSIQDPRERPADKQQASDQCHAVYKDKESDLLAWLNLWNIVEEQRQALSNNQFKRYCEKHFLSHARIREWREVHRQLHLFLKQLSFVEKTEDATYDQIHCAVLSGLLGNIGRHDEKREYIGCRNRRFMLSPGSGLNKKRPKWIVSAEIVETQKIYARNNAQVQPEWIEQLAGHLVKKSWSEPHWQAKRAQVVAKERVTLYGLEIVSQRVVNYGAIDPVVSREIFIRSGLIEGEYKTNDSAIVHNRELIQRLEAIEDRTRRKDVVVDDEVIYELYDKFLPAHVVSGASFLKWRKKSANSAQDILKFSEDDLRRSQAEDFDPSLFPDYLDNNGIKFPLSYCFDPGKRSDGVNVSVPINAIRQISIETLDRGIPGLLREKCIQLIKNLPRTLRKNFVPVPDVVDRILPKIEQSKSPLLDALSNELRIATNVTVPIESWKLELLDDHLRINVQVVDSKGKLIEQGRDLIDLAEKVKGRVDENAKAPSSKQVPSPRSKKWEFGEILKREEVSQAGIIIAQYSSLKDHYHDVEKVYCLDENYAVQQSTLGIARLLSFKLSSAISAFNKLIPAYKKLGLLYAPIGQAKTLYDDLAMGSIVSYFLNDSLPTNEVQFEDLYNKHRGAYHDFVVEYVDVVYEILQGVHDLKKGLKGKVNLALALPMADLQAQVDRLVYEGFLSNTRYDRLKEIPRYLKAAQIRLDKMPREMGNERKYTPILTEWWKAYDERKQQHELQGVSDPKLEHFRWMLEEQRVSWYAQQLGTSETVSEKRLNKLWEEIRR